MKARLNSDYIMLEPETDIEKAVLGFLNYAILQAELWENGELTLRIPTKIIVSHQKEIK